MVCDGRKCICVRSVCVYGGMFIFVEILRLACFIDFVTSLFFYNFIILLASFLLGFWSLIFELLLSSCLLADYPTKQPFVRSSFKVKFAVI